MKGLLINGSPKVNGNTAFALAQMAEVFAAEGIETETIQVGSQQFICFRRSKAQIVTQRLSGFFGR